MTLGCRVVRTRDVAAHHRSDPSLAAVNRVSGSATTATGHRPAYMVKGSTRRCWSPAAHALVERLVDGGDPVDDGRGVRRSGSTSSMSARSSTPVRRPRSWWTGGWCSSGRPAVGATDAKRLVAYLADPLATTGLVLVAGGGALAQALTKAVGASGEVVDTSVGSGKARTQWLADHHLQGGPVGLMARPRPLGQHLGSDMGRLAGLLDTLAAAYGPGATVTAADLEPFLGEAGSLAPWT